jgi:hypothetical protein
MFAEEGVLFEVKTVVALDVANGADGLRQHMHALLGGRAAGVARLRRSRSPDLH